MAVRTSALRALLLAVLLRRAGAGWAASRANGSFGFALLTARHGYVAEEHTVTTDDGYVLTVFRLYRDTVAASTPVLLVHGLLQDCGAWVDPGPDAGLAYLLVDSGYDTWVGNTRGNAYAARHVRLNPETDAKFWEFSADEIGYYDIPATIDRVLSATGSSKLNYVGFSQGGGSALMALAERPEYCERVGALVALAPPTALRYMTSFLKAILRTGADYERDLSGAGVYYLFANNSQLRQLDERLSHYYGKRNPLCKLSFDILDTPHPGSVADGTYENVCGHFPAPTALRTVARYGQVSYAGRFQKYDYGPAENGRRYGSARPPAFELRSVRAPVLLVAGAADALVAPEDARWLARRLPNLEELFLVDDPQWNHFDMTSSRYTRDRLLPKIIQFLRKYSYY